MSQLAKDTLEHQRDTSGSAQAWNHWPSQTPAPSPTANQLLPAHPLNHHILLCVPTRNPPCPHMAMEPKASVPCLHPHLCSGCACFPPCCSRPPQPRGTPDHKCQAVVSPSSRGGTVVQEATPPSRPLSRVAVASCAMLVPGLEEPLGRAIKRTGVVNMMGVLSPSWLASPCRA